jgi:D-inositol-3-phosphate glycosyltransferase
MLILLLSNRFPPNISGGAEIAAGDMAVALRQRGHDVRVLTSRDSDGQSLGDAPWIGRTLREVVDPTGDRRGSPRGPIGRTVALYRQTHSRSSARTVLEAVSTMQPDLLYIWDVSGIGLVSVLRALRGIRIPIVFQLASYWWHYVNSPETSFSTVRALQLKKVIIGRVPPLWFTTLIATSNTVKQAYVRVGCPADRIEVIDNAIDASFLDTPHRAARTNVKPVLMYAGRLCAEKGVMVALQAVDLLVNRQHRAIRLRIYGSGDPRYEEHLRAYASTHGLDDMVSFHGLVPRDQLLRAYDAADVLLVPSLWEEPFGLVAVEAMARAVPVVASDAGGLNGVVEDGVSGALVTPGDPGDLAAAVKRLLDRPDERRRFGKAGQQAVRARYTLDMCAQRVERHLERALALNLQECQWVE